MAANPTDGRGLRATGTFGGDNGRRTGKGEDVTMGEVVDARLEPPSKRTVGFGSGRKGLGEKRRGGTSGIKTAEIFKNKRENMIKKKK